MKKTLALFLFIPFLFSPKELIAQKVGVKTNLIYDALTTINVGAEFRVLPKWTIDVSGNINPWTFSNDRKWKHWLVQPEVRYWVCEPFNGHFWGAHLLGGAYNIGNLKNNIIFWDDEWDFKNKRYEGWFVGLGVVYGYSWMLSKYWNLEGVIGLGYAYTRYDEYRCAKCGKKIKEDHQRNYFGPTKVGVNLIYAF